MKIIYSVLAVCLAVLLSSCASQKTSPLSKADASAMMGKSLTLSNGPGPPFPIVTPVDALGGFAAGMAATAVSGNTIVGTSVANAEMGTGVSRGDVALSDPAPAMAQRLADALARKHGCKVKGTTGTEPNDSAKKLAARAAGYDYILDVRNVGWGAVYLPLKWLSYQIGVHYQVQIIQISTGRVICKGRAVIQTKDDPGERPGLSDLKENNHALVRSEIQRLSTRAEAQLKQQVLGL